MSDLNIKSSTIEKSLDLVDGVQLYQGLERYFQFYNHERGHQSLAYETALRNFLRLPEL